MDNVENVFINIQQGSSVIEESVRCSFRVRERARRSKAFLHLENDLAIVVGNAYRTLMIRLHLFVANNRQESIHPDESVLRCGGFHLHSAGQRFTDCFRSDQSHLTRALPNFVNNFFTLHLEYQRNASSQQGMLETLSFPQH